jgi:Rrf2 family nitric oxide-sensitive transcriptional repressor
MHFTEFTDYSLRVLIYLHMKEDGKSTVKQVAEYYNISQNHLVKVVHSLGLKGYIKSEKGKGGGIRLNMPANEINIGEVIKKMEPHFDLVACFNDGNRPCRVEPFCALKGVLGTAMDSFFNVVDQYTLADAVDQKVKLE